jgi:Protein of unknown function (DUF2652)
VAVEQALLIIADIGGYTRFMKLHRLSLAHSHDITTRLLEAMIDAAPQLKLVGTEGDAAFFYISEKEGAATATSDAAAEASLTMHQAFHARQQWMIACNMCSCDACQQAGQLKVKFVAHVGEVASQTINRQTKLSGLDVILIHRMLKNPVPVPEYILMTEPIYRYAVAPLQERATAIDQELEGLGTTRLYFVDITGIACELPPSPEPNLARKMQETLGVMGRTLPSLLGLRRPHNAEQT